MSHSFDIIVVGGGHAGAQSAIALRQQSFKGSIAIISAESELPYERPPLSKEYLAGEKTFDRLQIRPEIFWRERGVDLRLGERVVEVAPAAKAVLTDRGAELTYGSLIWAAGGAPRRLSCAGADLAGVHAVRTRADVDAIISDLPRVRQVVVIGGGYIGLEAAAVLIKLGKSVTLLEALPRTLARVAGEEISAFYEAEHRSHGVDVRTSVEVDHIVSDSGRARGVQLRTGEIVPAEIVIIGIGITPSVEPLVRAGAAASNGLDVDHLCRTSLPGVYAIGDCASHVSRFADGARVRLESVQNANDMAAVVAKALTGAPASYDALPWFWSNQYDLRLQTIGLSTGHDSVIVRGDPATRSFSAVYLKCGRVIALDCVNATKDYVQGRALILADARPAPSRLADTTIALKELA